jgi:hypothetical protein
MADSDSSRTPDKSSGCAFAIGVLVFIALTLVALFSTHLVGLVSSSQTDAIWAAVTLAIVWAAWLGCLILLVRSLRKSKLDAASDKSEQETRN